jgi:hypothetical protein
MRNKLLRKIREIYCIKAKKSILFKGKNIYIVHNRFFPERTCYLQSDPSEMYDDILSSLYNWFIAGRIIARHTELRRIRGLRRDAIRDGYTFREIPWLEK